MEVGLGDHALRFISMALSPINPLQSLNLQYISLLLLHRFGQFLVLWGSLADFYIMPAFPYLTNELLFYGRVCSEVGHVSFSGAYA